MNKVCFGVLFLVLWASSLGAAQARFIVNDEAYSDKVSRAGERLIHEHKVLSLEILRQQVTTRAAPVELLPASHEKLEPTELYDRLLQSTLAVGTVYKCPDCGGWHFSGSSGFVLNERGIVCTCCHVLLEEDDKISESYLVASDSAGHVFPVKSVLSADTEADTCLLQIEASGLKALPLRSGSRPGEGVYCLSNPGGYFFMFSEGMIARLNERSSSEPDEHGRVTGAPGRPVLLLNITAEFAPGSSGAAVVDTYGNVVGQVASIADAGESPDGDQNKAASPSVPIRFCTASEEILRLTNPSLVKELRPGALKPAKKSKPRKAATSRVCPKKQAGAPQ
ncbi:MAG TPA: serine protease [Verrucomicrobiae bacterium]|nr:serine protease [Verrucomicrobiae bacterium]